MPRKIINKDTVILKNSLGEVDDEVTYQDTLLKNCFVQIKEGSAQGKTGMNPNDDSKLFVFDVGTLAVNPDTQAVRTFLPHEKWEKLPSAEKARYWTLAEGDVFHKQESETELSIVEFSYKSAGTKAMHHFEVHAR